MLICNIKYYSILKENVQISLKLESILHKKYKLLIRFIERFYRFLNKNDLPHNLFQRL